MLAPCGPCAARASGSPRRGSPRARRSTAARPARARLPSISRVTTCGLPTVSSKPSRRIASTSTASCSSPRPWTSQVSGRSVSSTRIATLPTSSASRRSLTCRAVRRCAGLAGQRRGVDADRHAERGLLDAITGSGRGSSGSAIVSPIVISGMPASGDRSRPARPRRRRTRCSPSVTYSSATATRSHRSVAPAPRHRLALARSCPGARGRARGGRRRRRRRGWSRAPAAGGPPRTRARGSRRSSSSSSGRRSVPSSPSVELAQPGLGVRVDDRELDLLLVGVEVEEQLVDLVDHLGDARVGPVHLVHAQHHRQPAPRAPCAARSASGAAAPRRRRRAASPRRPWSARAPPRRRSRRGRACRPG